MNRFNLLPPGVSSWSPAGIFPEGAKPRGLTKMAKARTKIIAIFGCLKLNLRVFDASAEGASKNFRIFCTRKQHMTSSFSKSRGGQLCQIAPSGQMGIMYRSFIYRKFGFVVIILIA